MRRGRMTRGMMEGKAEHEAGGSARVDDNRKHGNLRRQ